MDLLAADGMGEEIRVLVQTRDLDVESVLDLALLGRAVVRDRQPS